MNCSIKAKDSTMKEESWKWDILESTYMYRIIYMYAHVQVAV